jgi:hypothetical protein
MEDVAMGAVAVEVKIMVVMMAFALRCDISAC